MQGLWRKRPQDPCHASVFYFPCLLSLLCSCTSQYALLDVATLLQENSFVIVILTMKDVKAVAAYAISEEGEVLAKTNDSRLIHIVKASGNYGESRPYRQRAHSLEEVKLGIDDGDDVGEHRTGLEQNCEIPGKIGGRKPCATSG